jgi:hypothetical protein
MANRWLPSLAALLAAQILCTAVGRAQETAAPYQGAQSAAPASGYIVVTAPEADVLADPRSGAAVVLKGFKGDLFPLKGQQGEWFLVATGDSTSGWLRRGTAALLMYPEFLDPVRLRESYTPPPYVPPRAYGFPGGGYRRVPYPWQDPLWWGLWYYDQKHDDDDDDHHHHGHDDDHDDHRGRGRGDRDDRGDRDRGRQDRGGDSRPLPQRDPRQR